MPHVHPERHRVCPERPELFDGLPLGMYPCPACGCMVVAGMPHPRCDVDTCDLDEIPDEEFEEMVVGYSKAHEPLLDPAQPPSSPGLPPGFAWTWVTDRGAPHWAIRPTQIVGGPSDRDDRGD